MIAQIPDRQAWRRAAKWTLEPERIGVHLSEEQQLQPEQSTHALVVQYSEANAA
jgi:cobalamin-dependent methionine synthase I